MSNNSSQAKEAAEYFKSKKGFHSLFTLFIKKYKSLGRIGGSVIIKNAAAYEKIDVGGFLGEDLSRDTDVKVSLIKFEKAFQSTKFKEVTLENVLQEYTGKIILSNREVKESYENKQKAFFEGFSHAENNPLQNKFLETILNKSTETQQLYIWYKQDENMFKQAFGFVFRAINKLPLLNYQRLPIFASKITSNPHYFDINEYGGKLLINALQIILSVLEGKEIVSSPNAEVITDILGSFGILRDDINNYVSTYGIRGYDEAGNEDILLNVAYKGERVLNIPLRELHQIKEIKAINDTIFVVENSGLFSSLVDMLIEKKIKATVVCSNGQMTLATLMLFKKSDAQIFYSGDYDPEGITMAKGMRNKFGQRVHYWRYSADDYLNSLSNVEMNSGRMAKLNNILDDELEPVITALKNHRRSGYQEEQILKLFEDIANGFNYAS